VCRKIISIYSAIPLYRSRSKYQGHIAAAPPLPVFSSTSLPSLTAIAAGAVCLPVDALAPSAITPTTPCVATASALLAAPRPPSPPAPRAATIPECTGVTSALLPTPSSLPHLPDLPDTAHPASPLGCPAAALETPPLCSAPPTSATVPVLPQALVPLRASCAGPIFKCPEKYTLKLPSGWTINVGS